ncbi:Lipid-A-disaccharide synthase [Piscirickettsia salmonis]|uniref:lipid-A-disaccharide synthase n=1 Tax=Piscirickettsia salmonis TaxID=1238 RepID=UPI0012B7890B|nr:lipid-A-disaccharide synthase [Piscirickettsia salmonis]QGP49408.1 Lipid-A-disaccharide synthase [Piscirickettsia salmonis]
MTQIAILAGEASGDLLGAGLCEALFAIDPKLELTGVTGPLMAKAGCTSIASIDRLSVMGFSAVIAKLPSIIAFHYELLAYFKKNKPDLIIAIDAPDFNLRLEKKLKHLDIPVIHYVSPTVWAWKEKRIYKVQAACDVLLTIFPFEPDYYKKIHHSAYFIGHPLADQIPLALNRHDACRALGLDKAKRYVALLPGSRRSELELLGPEFLKTAKLLAQKYADLEFIAPMANEKRFTEFKKLCQEMAPELIVHSFLGQTRNVVTASEVVLVTSGTATLETMLLKRPMVVAYKMSAFNYFLAKRFVKTPFIAMPNILANQMLVPEMIQDQVQAELLYNELVYWLDDPEKVTRLKDRFNQLHQSLRKNASENAAKIALDLLGSKSKKER